MEYVSLTEDQLDALLAATHCKKLVQIQPDETLDQPEVYAVWLARVNQVNELVNLGLLEELPTEGDESLEKVKVKFPGRKFKMYQPSALGQRMFSQGIDTVVN